MPRIFQVTFRREYDCTIVADSEAELEEALKAADIDDWDSPEWEWDISDPLARLKKVEDLDRVPDFPKDPTMGVLDGEVLAFCDVKAEIPDILDQVTESIKGLKRTITLDEVNGKLFPIAKS